MAVTADRIKELARDYLSTKNQHDISRHLENNQPGLAQACLLNGISELKKRGEIDLSEAQRVHSELGVQ